MDGTTPSPKRPKVQQRALPEEHCCLAADISEPLVHEIKLQKDWPVLQVRGSDTCHLVNNTQKAWSMNDCGACFYGAGSYKILKAGQDLPERSVELVLTSHADTIVVSGAVTTLGQAFSEMRQKKPDCRIAYFEIQPGESLSEFQLRATHRVVFYGKEETATLARHNCAWALLKSHLTPVWHMRWAAKGLLPVKPALHILGGMELEVGKAVRLTQSQSCGAILKVDAIRVEDSGSKGPDLSVGDSAKDLLRLQTKRVCEKRSSLSLSQQASSLVQRLSQLAGCCCLIFYFIEETYDGLFSCTTRFLPQPSGCDAATPRVPRAPLGHRAAPKALLLQTAAAGGPWTWGLRPAPRVHLAAARNDSAAAARCCPDLACVSREPSEPLEARKTRRPGPQCAAAR